MSTSQICNEKPHNSSLLPLPLSSFYGKKLSISHSKLRTLALQCNNPSTTVIVLSTLPTKSTEVSKANPRPGRLAECLASCAGSPKGELLNDTTDLRGESLEFSQPRDRSSQFYDYETVSVSLTSCPR
ncbi:hypothetical protein OIU79_018460 [Salix purpurea]|uniref:Uncharacterized protein n=1 Tax=Salix purpurea TaxID=77065 RepID=A0A9Q0X0Y4_SALPP|nr:hypothetical protein OIU79_018460 [Salix purpurea]